MDNDRHRSGRTVRRPAVEHRRLCVFGDRRQRTRLLRIGPLSAVRTIVLCSCAIQLYSVWKLRASIRWRPLWLLLLSGALTVPMGVWLLIRLDASFYVAGLGLFLIGYGSVVLVRRETRRPRR